VAVVNAIYFPLGAYIYLVSGLSKDVLIVLTLSFHRSPPQILVPVEKWNF
jgi:hypothetical protein